MFNLPTPPNIVAPPQGAFGNPGGLEDPNTNIKDMLRNAGLLQVQEGQERNQLIPDFARQMFGYAQPAGQFFNTLMNLGSPFYQEKQRQSFEQGTQQNQNAAAGARDQLNAAGYGYSPSGATAGMIGGMGIGGAKSIAEQFLQNLFQNEQLQLAGGQGLSQLASLFNPAQLFGQNSFGNTTQGPSATDEFSKLLGSIFGSSGIGGTSIPGVGGK